MGLNIKALTGIPAAKFEEIGATAEGHVEAAEMIDDPKNIDKQVPVITLVDDSGSKAKLWVRSHMVDALNEALDKAGETELEVGGWLRVTYTGDRQLRNGRTMKLYSAQYLGDSETAFGLESL